MTWFVNLNDRYAAIAAVRYGSLTDLLRLHSGRSAPGQLDLQHFELTGQSGLP